MTDDDVKEAGRARFARLPRWAQLELEQLRNLCSRQLEELEQLRNNEAAEERAAIYEYEAGMSRADAERKAFGDTEEK